MTTNNSIAARLDDVRSRLKEDTVLVAVSKYHTVEEIAAAYDAGQRDFGENHAQALTGKVPALPGDIRWHFIGHLQTNKVRQVVDKVHLIHSIDSLRLLKEVDKQAKRIGKVVNVLIQLHVASEETKFGFTPSECREFFAARDEWQSLHHVRICGLMAMATNTEDERQIVAEFDQVRTLFDELKSAYFSDDAAFAVRSYGMSDDYPLALQCGSNMVRVGTAIFGERRL